MFAGIVAVLRGLSIIPNGSKECMLTLYGHVTFIVLCIPYGVQEWRVGRIGNIGNLLPRFFGTILVVSVFFGSTRHNTKTSAVLHSDFPFTINYPRLPRVDAHRHVLVLLPVISLRRLLNGLSEQKPRKGCCAPCGFPEMHLQTPLSRRPEAQIVVIQSLLSLCVFLFLSSHTHPYLSISTT